MGCAGSRLTTSEAAILRVGELVHDGDVASQKKPGSGHKYLDEAIEHLPKIDDADRDNYSILVYSRHGRQFYAEGDLRHAIQSYQTAINLAEVKIAQRCPGLYLMLQRYAECMTDIARIWIRSSKGYDARRASGAVSIHVENRVSIMDINSPTSPVVTHPSIRRKRRDEATAEIVLLRCIETIEQGHNRRSDLLVEPLMLLASLYESLELHSRAELLVRRCIGILIVQFGHDHPRLNESNAILENLVEKKAAKNREKAAVKIHATWKMFVEMRKLQSKLGRQVTRHILSEDPRRTPTPPPDYLAQVVGDGDLVDDVASQSPAARQSASPLNETAGSFNTTNSSDPPQKTNSFFGVAPTAAKNSESISPRFGSRRDLVAAAGARGSLKSLKGIAGPVLSTAEGPIAVAAPRVWQLPAADGDDGDDGVDL
jgi:hypothetical protein